jgi:hypothetical protein
MRRWCSGLAAMAMLVLRDLIVYGCTNEHVIDEPWTAASLLLSGSSDGGLTSS